MDRYELKTCTIFVSITISLHYSKLFKLFGLQSTCVVDKLLEICTSTEKCKPKSPIFLDHNFTHQPSVDNCVDWMRTPVADVVMLKLRELSQCSVPSKPSS